MPAELLTDGIWPRITALAKQRKGIVAVAYLARRARTLLPLLRGSLLVVNASERTVGAGLTDPAELRWFLKRGVEVYSVENLHAKVFVFGDTAIIGSTNVSQHSAGRLLEAAVLVRTRPVVAACRKFVVDMTEVQLTLPQVERLSKLYRPPTFPGEKQVRRAQQKSKRRRIVSEHPPLWLVSLDHDTWDDEDREQAKKARPGARAKIHRATEELDEFQYTGKPFCERLSEGDLVIQVWSEGRKYYVSQAAHVVKLKRYTKGPRKRESMIVFLGVPRPGRPKEYSRLLAGLSPRHRQVMRNLDKPHPVRDDETRAALLRAWRATPGK